MILKKLETQKYSYTAKTNLTINHKQITSFVYGCYVCWYYNTETAVYCSVPNNNNKEYEVVNALLSIIWKDNKAN